MSWSGKISGVTNPNKVLTEPTSLINSIGKVASTDAYLVLEDRTDDLAANAGNAERMWMRSDLATPTVKGVIKSNNGTYEVKTFTIT